MWFLGYEASKGSGRRGVRSWGGGQLGRRRQEFAPPQALGEVGGPAGVKVPSTWCRPTARLHGGLVVPSFSRLRCEGRAPGPRGLLGELGLGLLGPQTSGPYQAEPSTQHEGRCVMGSEPGQTSGVCECGVLRGRLGGARLRSCGLLRRVHHLLGRGRGGAKPWGQGSQSLARLAWVCRAGTGRGRGLAQHKSQSHRPATRGASRRAHLVEFLMAVHLVFVHKRQQDPVTQEGALGQRDPHVRAQETPPPVPAPKPPPPCPACTSLPPRWRSVLWPG